MANEKRLIDANEITVKLAGNAGHILRQENGEYSVGRARGIMDAVDLIKRLPAVDVVEVIHAHWEDGCAIHNGKEVYKSIDCSRCNEIFKTEDREYWKKRFKMCPFCGAIMDGERRTDGK